MFRSIYSQPTKELNLEKELQELGLRVCPDTGHLFADDLKPLQLDYELVFVRHGETYGNCGQSTKEGTVDASLVIAGTRNNKQRIFQGDVDTEINKLTAQGKLQALAAAKKMKAELLSKGWIPDVILASPLSRAKDTATPFVRENRFQQRFKVHEGIREISFGSWDNLRVCDFTDEKDPSYKCHQFYLEQHTLVKGEDRIDNEGKTHKAESFCDLLLRAKQVLLSLNKEYAGKKVVMFSHSMFGAACSILLGKGQKTKEGYFAFDGEHIMPHATPIQMNFEHKEPKVELKTMFMS